jgi:predicted nucleic acid-binding protein
VSESPIVLDASAAIAIIRLEPPASALLAALRDTVAKGSRRLVPDGFWLELVNVLIRRYRATPERAIEAIRDIDDLGVESVRIDRPLLLVAIDLQARFGLSAYDASYLALADTADARLLTLDRQLSFAAGARAIRIPGLGQDRVSELPAQYGEPVDWARFGPYLARLRADAHKAAGA